MNKNYIKGISLQWMVGEWDNQEWSTLASLHWSRKAGMHTRFHYFPILPLRLAVSR